MSLRFKVLSVNKALLLVLSLVLSLVVQRSGLAQAAGEDSDSKNHSAAKHSSSSSSRHSSSHRAERSDSSKDDLSKGTKKNEDLSPASSAGASDKVSPVETGPKTGKGDSGVEQKSCSPLELDPKSAKKPKSKFLDTPPCLTWLDAGAETEPKAVILAVHGLGLHMGTYKDFGERMAKLGYVVYAVDVRGFGSYMAAQGREKVDFEDCLEDVRKTLKFIHKVHPALPVFLLGESMGGAIALRVTALNPNLVDGLVSSVPSGDRFHQGETKLKVALKLLTAPNKQFDVGTGVINQATKKADLKEQWAQDPFARLNLSANELLQFQQFMNENFHTVKRICSTPVLMVQGKEDKLVKPAGTMALFNNIVCKDKQMLLIEHGEHLIFEEGQFDDQVIQDVDKWLKTHLEKKQGGGHISSK